MRAILASLLLLLASASAFAQRTTIASSTFDGDEDPLSEAGAWEQLNSANSLVSKVSGSALAAYSAQGIVRRASGAYAESQFASAVLTTANGMNNDAQIGVVVNASADTDAARDYFGYYFDEGTFGGSSGDSRTTLLVRVANGTETTITSSSIVWSAGDQIEIEYDAATDTLSGLKNGVVQVSGSAATLGVGRPGLISASSYEATSWSGGDLSAGGASNAPRAMHYKRLMQ